MNPKYSILLDVVVPVFDAAPDSDHAAVHDQETDDLDDGPVFDTYPDDLEGGPVFDTEPVPDRVAVTVLDQGPGDLSAARAGVVFNGDILSDEDFAFSDKEPRDLDGDFPFNKEPERETVLLLTTQDFVVGTNITASTGTSTQGSGAAGCEWHQEQFNADVSLLVPVHDIATASHMRFRLVLSDSVDPDRVDVIQCWDPGLHDGSAYLVVAWYYADVYPAYFSGLAINPLRQQKCGGCHGRDNVCIMLACAHLQSVAHIISLVQVNSSQIDNFSEDRSPYLLLHMATWAQKGTNSKFLSAIWIILGLVLQGNFPAYSEDGVLQVSQWDQLELVNSSCMQESVIEGVALSPGYSHLPAPVSVSFLGSNAAVFTQNILGILFQLVAGELVQLGYFTEYNFLWMSDRSTITPMVSLISYIHYCPNQKKKLFHLSDQKVPNSPPYAVDDFTISGSALSSGVAFTQKILLVSPKEVPWQLVISARLGNIWLYKPVSISVYCQWIVVLHCAAVEQGHYCQQLSVFLIIFLLVALSHRQGTGNAHRQGTCNALVATPFHRLSLFVQYYSSAAIFYARPKWFDDILATDAAEVGAAGLVATMSMPMDAVLNWSLYSTIGSGSIRLSSPGSMMGVLLTFLLCGSFVVQIQWGIVDLTFLKQWAYWMLHNTSMDSLIQGHLVMATGYQWGALILFCYLVQVQFHLGEHRLLSADWMEYYILLVLVIMPISLLPSGLWLILYCSILLLQPAMWRCSAGLLCFMQLGVILLMVNQKNLPQLTEERLHITWKHISFLTAMAILNSVLTDGLLCYTSRIWLGAD